MPDNEELPPPANELEAKERAREKRKADMQAARDAQRLLDLNAIDEIEIALGDSNVMVIDVPYTPGLPTCVACRTPTDPELKRYRHMVTSGATRNDEGKAADPMAGIKAAEQLADVVRVYPPDEQYAELRKARPGIHLQLGVSAVSLAVGSKEKTGKA
jgi:hypothetical protein